MKNDQKNIASEQAAEVNDTILTDKELENASGGFEMPTLIDFCQSKFEPKFCINAPWGVCKHFSKVFIKQEQGIFQTCYYYAGNCDKGCFKEEPIQEFM